MQIEVPDGESGSYVRAFLDGLDEVQRFEAYDRIEGYEKMTHLELLNGGKLENLGDHLYKLEVRVKDLRLRFFGVMCKGVLFLLHGFKKKTPRIPDRELKTARRRAASFLCPN